MFCSTCGEENANDAKFCKKCGQPLAGGAVSQKETGAPGETANVGGGAKLKTDFLKVGGAAASSLYDKRKAIPQKVLLGACAAVVLLIVIIIVASGSGKTIDLNKYLTIEAEGYDGYGTANVKIDWAAIEDKYGEKLEFKAAAEKQYGELIDMVTPVGIMEECVRVELDENQNLTNGQEIAYKWDIDDSLSRYVKCKVKYKDDTYKVSGLEKIGTFDAFADVTLEFAGTSPDGTVNVNYTGTDMQVYDFVCDRYNGLSNGETIKLTIDESRLQYYVQTIGKVPETLEKEYTVEGLASYLTAGSQIDEESLTKIKQQAKDVYTAYTARDWNRYLNADAPKEQTLEAFSYIGNYLLTSKSETGSGGNRLYLVFKAQVKNYYVNGDNTYNQSSDVYWYIQFNDLMIGNDGKLTVDITRYNTPSTSFQVDSEIGKSWSYTGYNTLDALYNDVVMKNVDSYNHEDSVDESNPQQL